MEIYLVILIIYLLYVNHFFSTPINKIVNYLEDGNKIAYYKNNYEDLKLNIKENTENGINYLKENLSGNISSNIISDTFVKEPINFLKRLQNFIFNFNISNKIKPIIKRIYDIFYIYELDKYYKKTKNKIGLLPILNKLGYPQNISIEAINTVKNIVFLISNIYLVHKCYNDLNDFDKFTNTEKINYFKNISCMLFLFNKNYSLAKEYIKYFYNLIFNNNVNNNDIQNYLNSLKRIVIDKINLVNLFIEKLTVKLMKATNIEAEFIESDEIEANNIKGESIEGENITSKQSVSDEIIVKEIHINNAIVQNAKVTDIECNKMVVTSDIRKKKNIKKMDINIDDLERINAYKYQYKDSISAPHGKEDDFHIGLIAQELENIYPELVIEKNGVKKVNYIGMIPILIENIKKLRSKIK